MSDDAKDSIQISLASFLLFVVISAACLGMDVCLWLAASGLDQKLAGGRVVSHRLQVAAVIVFQLVTFVLPLYLWLALRTNRMKDAPPPGSRRGMQTIGKTRSRTESRTVTDNEARPNPRPRRRWFRIHLSTAVVLMVVAGVYLGFNVTAQRHYRAEYSAYENFEDHDLFVEHHYGFPLTFRIENSPVRIGLLEEPEVLLHYDCLFSNAFLLLATLSLIILTSNFSDRHGRHWFRFHRVTWKRFALVFLFLALTFVALSCVPHFTDEYIHLPGASYKSPPYHLYGWPWPMFVGRPDRLEIARFLPAHIPWLMAGAALTLTVTGLVLEWFHRRMSPVDHQASAPPPGS